MAKAFQLRHEPDRHGDTSRFALVRWRGSRCSIPRDSDGATLGCASDPAPVTRVTDRISVLLVDDHPIVRRGLRRLLEDDPAITVIGEAGDGDTAVSLAVQLQPHVVVMDCSMPTTSGVAATKRILAQAPQVCVLMLSVHSEGALVHQALEAGARGYVLKEALDLDLAHAVKQVATGEPVIDPRLSQAVITRRHGSQLSPRQREVLQLMCDGLPEAAIASRLGVSAHTVAAHRAAIMRALDIHRAAELVAYALRHRLVDRF